MKIALPGLLAVLAALGAPDAGAHATLEQQSAKIGSTYKGVLRVPHGCDGEATLKVRIQIPDGMIAVKPMPKAGWTLEIVRGPYQKAYDYYGRSLTEGVRELVWIGELSDAHYDEFVFRGMLANSLPADTMLYFPTVQECRTKQERWVEIPAAGQDPHDLDGPAPGLMLLAAASSHDHAAAGPIAVDHPWSRASAPGAIAGAAFMTLTNRGAEADRLVAAKAEVSETVELHTHIMDGGIMRMRPVEAIDVPAGGSTDLKPGGLHVMFIGLKQPLAEGKSFPLTLVFEKAGTVQVDVSVAPIGAPGPAGGHSHH